MPMPWTYRHASREWRAVLGDARERMGLESDNMAYTAIDGVLRTFRRRVTAAQGLSLASVLPAVPRAILVADWIPGDPPDPFAPRAEMAAEARALRADHNLTPPDAIEAVAWTLRRHVDQRALDRVLERIGPEAAAFWRVDAPEAELARRIV
jgi:uncharacterized protein (DUF2267 family)